MKKVSLFLVVVVGLGMSAEAQWSFTATHKATGSCTSDGKVTTMNFATKQACEDERNEWQRDVANFMNCRIYYDCTPCTCKSCPTTSNSPTTTTMSSGADLKTQVVNTAVESALDVGFSLLFDWLFNGAERRREEQALQLELQRLYEEQIAEEKRIQQEQFQENAANIRSSLRGVGNDNNRTISNSPTNSWGLRTEAVRLEDVDVPLEEESAKGGYALMCELGKKNGLDFSDYMSKERWDKASSAETAKTMSNGELSQWHADYSRFMRDLYGADPIFNVIDDFTNELKTELKELGITVATVLVSAATGGIATTGVFLTPASAKIVEATAESVASIAKDINRDRSIDLQKAIGSGANVFIGSAISDYGKVTYNVYIVGKTIYNEKGIINKKMAAETTKIIAEKLGIENGNILPIEIVLSYI